jgi:hypothetical protein
MRKFALRGVDILAERRVFVPVQFVLELLQQRPVYSKDKISGAEHFVSPPSLASRIMALREALASDMKKFNFHTYIARNNVEVLRQHLEKSSYTSGSFDKIQRQRRQQRKAD